MPAVERVAALNLGMQTVTMAVFSKGSGGSMNLAGLARADLLPDPSADATRAGQLRIALGELRAKLKWSNGASALAVPSQGVFARFVKIPKVEPDKADQMLFFEAQQNVPYPIEEVSWCYQVLPEPEEDKLGALILATKLDQLESTVESVQAAGFSPSVIEASPTALYNALRYNYPDLTGCTLLIDLGARATNLIFTEGDKLFIRTLPVGGNTITAAVQKKFESRSLAEIEQLKIEQAFIPPPGNYDASGDAAEMGKIARTVMTRIHNEITRSITFYRTNQLGSAPVRVLLAGGDASLPYCLEFFNEKLSLPVEFFNPLRRVAVEPAVDDYLVRRSSHALGECTGLAARLLFGEAPLQVHLPSPRLEASKRESGRRPFLAAALGLLAAAVALAFFHYKTAADRVAEKNAGLDTEIAGLQEFKKQLDAAAGERNRLLADAADLAAAPMLRTVWAGILDEVSQKIPARNIWVTGLRPVAGEQVLDPAKKDAVWGAEAGEAAEGEEAQPSVTAIAVDGLYLENDGGPAVVDAFVDALAGSELFAIDPEKKTEVVKLRAAQSGESWAYDYQLVLPLKRPIPL